MMSPIIFSISIMKSMITVIITIANYYYLSMARPPTRSVTSGIISRIEARTPPPHIV